MAIEKQRNTFLAQWWWAIDRVILACILVLMAFSAFMVATASPAVAERIGIESLFFIRKQIIYLLLSLIIIFGISLLSADLIKKFSLIGFITGVIMLVLVLFMGAEFKGAKRWLSLFGFSLQPSEFIKPFFSVITAWLLSQKYKDQEFPAFSLSLFIYAVVACLIILQPDLGMTITLTIIWAGQLFLAGISFFWVFLSGVGGALIITLAYFFLPHVSKRIDNFLNPEQSENYQVMRSLEAFVNGGFYGTGPGEGVVKQFIPDSHTDFIFAVIGEELGFVTCVLVIFIYCLVVIRSLFRMCNESDTFLVFAVSGIIIQFGIQSMINMGVTLNLLPTKGMTLPFISYGGSSMFAIAIAVGIILALTKRKFGSHKYHKARNLSYKLKELT
ncbi:MAG: putative lipid II flippase FtsW [Sphingobacteriia bacterium]|nr:putative lipid II flippase FtsW [Sphingobacteriia bacterium]